MEKIRVVLADDNYDFVELVKEVLQKDSEIEILGSAYSAEQEISMIDELKPDIVVTDLYKNGELSGIDIIKKYKDTEHCPKFLVITAGDEGLIDLSIIDGFIKKPFSNYDIIAQKIKIIKRQNESVKMPVKIEKNNVGKVRKMWQYILNKIRNNINKKER